MLLILRSKSGIRLTEKVDDKDLTLLEAKRKYDSPLFSVIDIKEDVKGTLSNFDACSAIYNKGLDYAVRNYASGVDFKDTTTGDLWDKADNAISNLLEYLDFDNYE